ncbi:MAG: hypothetical protein DMG13_21380 [Acidobacteria bacterium]|nr:MAG: hypothetical protein DMG13_21380 [Acidobacteriota bacterium]
MPKRLPEFVVAGCSPRSAQSAAQNFVAAVPRAVNILAAKNNLGLLCTNATPRVHATSDRCTER